MSALDTLTGRPTGADPVDGYADAVVAIASVEGAMDRVSDELFRFARAVDANPQLRDRLIDPGIDAAAKLGVVSGLLEGKALPQTLAAVMLVVQAGRARQLTEVADAVARKTAATQSRVVAEASTAVPLTPEQTDRLRDAVGRATGKDVDLKVVVDPTVVGGVVVKVGDTVIDGSVARRLSDLKARLVGA